MLWGAPMVGLQSNVLDLTTVFLPYLLNPAYIRLLAPNASSQISRVSRRNCRMRGKQDHFPIKFTIFRVSRPRCLHGGGTKRRFSQNQHVNIVFMIMNVVERISSLRKGQCFHIKVCYQSLVVTPPSCRDPLIISSQSCVGHVCPIRPLQ